MVGRRVAGVLLVVSSATLAACSAGSSAPAPPPAPSARSDPAAAFDESRQRLVLFGGADAAGHALGDTWLYDKNGWQQARGAGPSPRSGAALVYNQEKREVVLVGGRNGAVHLDDTWIWNGKAWSRGVTTLDAPARDANAVALAFDRTRLTMVLIMCCTTGDAPHAMTFVGDGHHWNLQDRSFANDPPVAAAAGYASASFDLVTGRVVVVSPGGINGPATMGAWNGATWETLAPLQDLIAPKGARIRLVETPDDGKLVAMVEAGSGPAVAWRWDGVRWTVLTASGMPVRIAAATVDIRDGEALVVGGPDASHDTASVLGWRKSALHPPQLGGKAKLEPTFGSASPNPVTPEPVQAIRPLRDYPPTLAQLPRGFDYSSLHGRGAPIPADQNGGATDSWEVAYDAPGPKRILVFIYLYASSVDAGYAAYSLGHPSDVPNSASVTGFPMGTDVAAVWRAPVGDGTIEIYSISWQEGRLAFAVIDRDYKGVLGQDDVIALARIVDAKAR